MELARYLLLVRKWWWLLVAGTLAAGVASYAISKTLTPIYSSTATLLVNQTQVPGTIAYNDILTSERLTRTYKELIEKSLVLEEVSERLDLPYGPGQLAAMISVSVVSDTQLLRLSVESSDPALASGIANTAASVFIEQNTENQLSRPGDVSIVEAATTPSVPVKPHVLLNTVMAAAIGLLLAAEGREQTDDHRATDNEAEQHADAYEQRRIWAPVNFALAVCCAVVAVTA